MMIATTLARFAVAAILTFAVVRCSSTRLSDGLTERMDTGGAQLNTAEAVGIINQYRATVGVGPLSEDPALSAQAQVIAANYAKTGRQATKPEGTSEIRYSAGTPTFAETFSGWRASPEQSLVMSGKSVTRVGIATVYVEASPYGVYWVVIVA